MATITGGYPSLETVMNLVRVFTNDWQAGATNTPGEGQITTDNPLLSPQTLPALNSAIRELYRELRNVGAPRLIRDNVQVNIPANGATGPNVQTYLSFTGYFDGQTLQPSPVLPSDLMFPLELWEQQTGSALPFIRMTQPEFGLPSPFNQGFALVYWEWREDNLNFVGTLTPITVRMRYEAALTQFVTPVNFPTTFIPIMDCEEAVAYKVAYKISLALSGAVPSIAELKTSAMDAMQQLKNEQVRRQQTVEYHRRPFTTGSRDGSSNSTQTW